VNNKTAFNPSKKLAKLTGNLVVANPLNSNGDGLDHGVVMIVSHTEEHVIGLQINRPISTLSLADVCARVDVDYDGDDLVFHGGRHSTNKIYVLHTMDWEGLTTIPLTDTVGITYDMSVLTAIARGEGPEHFTACAGFTCWDDDVLEKQLAAKPNSKVTHRWELIPATIDAVFNSGLGLEHWHSMIELCAEQQAAQWLQSFSG
jgi:putative transcriptional regulator